MVTPEESAFAWPLRPPAPAIALPSDLSSDGLRAAWATAHSRQAVGIELDLGDLDTVPEAWVGDHSTERPRLAVRTGCTTTHESEAVRILRDSLFRASRAGAEVLNLRLPALGDDAASGSTFIRYGDAMNFAYSLLRDTRLDAEAAGVAIAIEVEVGDWLHSPIEAGDLLDASGSCAVGVCLDAARFHRQAAIYDWISTLTRRVKCVRSPAAVGGATVAERIGAELFAALADVGYEGLVCLVEPGREVSGRLA